MSVASVTLGAWTRSSLFSSASQPGPRWVLSSVYWPGGVEPPEQTRL